MELRLYDKNKNQTCIKTERSLYEINERLVKKYLTKMSDNGIIVEKEILLKPEIYF